MKFWTLLGSAVLTSAIFVSVVHSADEPPKTADNTPKKAPKAPAKGQAAADATADADKSEAAEGPRYPKQLNRLPGLSDEQKKKLQQVAEKTAADRAALDAHARQDYLAILTDEQRKELEKIEQGGAGKKAVRKEAAKAKPTAEPPKGAKKPAEKPAAPPDPNKPEAPKQQ